MERQGAAYAEFPKHMIVRLQIMGGAHHRDEIPSISLVKWPFLNGYHRNMVSMVSRCSLRLYDYGIQNGNEYNHMIYTNIDYMLWLYDYMISPENGNHSNFSGLSQMVTRDRQSLMARYGWHLRCPVAILRQELDQEAGEQGIRLAKWLEMVRSQGYSY